MKKYHRMTWLIILTVILTVVGIYIFMPYYFELGIGSKIIIPILISSMIACVLALFFYGDNSGGDYNGGQVNF